MPEGSTGDTRKNRVMIQIKKVTKGDKVEELKYKPLILGRLTGARPDTPIRDRQRRSINGYNFSKTMQDCNVRLDDLVVKSRLPGASDDDDLAVNLKFDNMKSFQPDEIVKQIPELQRLVELRSMLNAFIAKVGANKRLYNEFTKILASTDDFKQLLEELKKVQAASSEDGQA